MTTETTLPYNDYINAQIAQGNILAHKWTIFDRNHGVGHFDLLNNYADYKYLLKDLNSPGGKYLDFGCGPGRNIRNLAPILKKIDGVDLIDQNIRNSKKYLKFCGFFDSDFNYYKSNGYDLSEINDNSYDTILSTLTLEWICIYNIRYNYFKEFFRILNSGGAISMQMGYGPVKPDVTVDYNNNIWNVGDPLYGVTITDVSQLCNDLTNIGFVNFTYELYNPGPLEHNFEQWIFFKAYKP